MAKRRVSENYFEKFVSSSADFSAVTEFSCLEIFDKDGDGVLNLEEFGELCQSLIKQTSGKLLNSDIEYFMHIFDINKDGTIDKNEFKVVGQWCKMILAPVSALLIVDVQNDFISGSLALKNCPAGQDGAEVVPVINKLISKCPFDYFVYTLDWHPADHCSFVNNVSRYPINESCSVSAEVAQVGNKVIFNMPEPYEQVLWPAHCLQGESGAELHKKLKVHREALKVTKGTKSQVDSYSAFCDNMKGMNTDLPEMLRQRGVTDVYVTGLALDICVAHTAIDACQLFGLRTTVIEDACRGVDEGEISAMKAKMLEAGCAIVNSSEVKNMVKKKDRRIELARKAASLVIAINSQQD